MWPGEVRGNDASAEDRRTIDIVASQHEAAMVKQQTPVRGFRMGTSYRLNFVF